MSMSPRGKHLQQPRLTNEIQSNHREEEEQKENTEEVEKIVGKAAERKGKESNGEWGEREENRRQETGVVVA